MIQQRIDDKVAYVRLSNPDNRNALSPDVLTGLHETFSLLNTRSDVSVIVLEAEGTVFCAGADLKYLQQIREREILENLDDSRLMMKTFCQIYESPKIVIAKVQGDAIAGGTGLVSLCDYAVAAPTARFGFTEVAIGFVPAIVGVFLHRKIGEARSRHVLLNARIFSAEEARELGIVYQVVPQEELEEHTAKLAQSLAKHPQSSIRMTKNLLVHIADMDVYSALEYAATVNAASRQTPAFRQGVDAIISRISGERT